MGQGCPGQFYYFFLLRKILLCNLTGYKLHSVSTLNSSCCPEAPLGPRVACLWCSIRSTQPIHQVSKWTGLGVLMRWDAQQRTNIDLHNTWAHCIFEFILYLGLKTAGEGLSVWGLLRSSIMQRKKWDLFPNKPLRAQRAFCKIRLFDWEYLIKASC